MSAPDLHVMEVEPSKRFPTVQIDPKDLPTVGPDLATVEVSWFTSTAATYARLSAAPDDPSPFWSVVQDYPMGFTAGTNSIRVQVPRDARTCFVLHVADNHGDDNSHVQCLSTRDGLKRKLWRAQLQIRTATVGDSQTDSAINAGLNARSNEYLPWGGRYTWLDLPVDDFRNGETHTYELRTDGIADVSDIHQLIIENTGNDGLCISDLQLRINELPAFTRHFDTCAWIDTDDDPILSFDNATLRASNDWRALGLANPKNTATPTSYDQLDARVTLSVSEGIQNSDASFNNNEFFGATATRGNKRDYEYDLWYKWSNTPPLWTDVLLQFSINTSTTCDATNQAVGHIWTSDFDLDSSISLPGLDWMLNVIAEVIIEGFGPASGPSFATTIPLGFACEGGQPAFMLCFRADGLGPLPFSAQGCPTPAL